MTITLHTPEVVIVLALLAIIGGWAGTIRFGFGEVGPKWLVLVCSLICMAGITTIPVVVMGAAWGWW